MMTRETFISYMLRDDWVSILYACHKENSKDSTLDPMTFMQFVNMCSMRLDMDAFIQYVIKSYRNKFEIGMLYTKERKFIRYV